MTPVIQSLGRLDAELITKDVAYLALPQAEREKVDTSFELTDRVRDSYLWVLGAYEIVRSIDQRRRDNSGLVGEAAAKIIIDVKHKFERVRIPLAKFEPAKRYSDTDSSVALPGIDRDHGIAWRVSEDVFITRRELSDAFMELLRSI